MKAFLKTSAVILFRVIIFPAVAMIGLASALRLWFQFCLNFLANGGETIIFTANTNATIADILEIVEAKHEEDRREQEAWKRLLQGLDATEPENKEATEITVTYYP